MTRFFTQSQRRELYVLANGECQGCGCELGPGWHAHHIKPWSQGGVTEIDNAEALCEECHRWRHNGMGLREWQRAALETFRASDKDLVIEASVGSGKTMAMAVMAKDWLERGGANFVLVVTPGDSVKTSVQEAFHRVGLQLITRLGGEAPPGGNVRGMIINYHSLAGSLDVLRVWRNKGKRFISFFDEVHHQSNENTWGPSAARLMEISTRVVSMTGTPFRSDGLKIPSVQYDSAGFVVPDFRYSYSDAVVDKYVRPVHFVKWDSQYKCSFNGSVVEGQLSCAPEDRESRALDAALRAAGNTRSEFCSGMIAEMITQLDEIRRGDEHRKGHRNAAALVAVPGGEAEADLRVDWIAKQIEEMSGEKPTVVHSRDSDARAKVDAFREGAGRFIVAVNMVSEGTDIPRLRVLMLARAMFSDMPFRQVVGRIVRVNDHHPDTESPGDSVVIIPDLPTLRKLAERMQEEAETATRERDERDKSDGDESPERTPVLFEPLGGNFLPAGVIRAGERYEPKVYKLAREFMRTKALSEDDAFAMAKLAAECLFAPEVQSFKPDSEPLEVECGKIYERITRKVKACALAEVGGRAETEDYVRWSVKVANHLGAKPKALLRDLERDKLEAAEAFLDEHLISLNEARVRYV